MAFAVWCREGLPELLDCPHGGRVGRSVDGEQAFAGRRDFAPAVRLEGEAEFLLNGGAIGSYLDRKAAVFVSGLPWPTQG